MVRVGSVSIGVKLVLLAPLPVALSVDETARGVSTKDSKHGGSQCSTPRIEAATIACCAS